MDKIREQIIEKLAATRWRNAWHTLSPEAQAKIRGTVDLSPERWEKGLREGSDNIVKKLNILENPSNEELKREMGRIIPTPSPKTMKEKLLRKARVGGLNSDEKQLADGTNALLALNNKGIMYGVDPASTLEANNILGSGGLNIPRDLRPIVLSTDKGLAGVEKQLERSYGLDPLEGPQNGRNLVDQVVRRHEIDEIRSSKYNFKNNKMVENLAYPGVGTSSHAFLGHVSPAVVMREGENSIALPDEANDYMQTLRRRGREKGILEESHNQDTPYKPYSYSNAEKFTSRGAASIENALVKDVENMRGQKYNRIKTASETIAKRIVKTAASDAEWVSKYRVMPGLDGDIEFYKVKKLDDDGSDHYVLGSQFENLSDRYADRQKKREFNDKANQVAAIGATSLAAGMGAGLATMAKYNFKANRAAMPMAAGVGLTTAIVGADLARRNNQTQGGL